MLVELLFAFVVGGVLSILLRTHQYQTKINRLTHNWPQPSFVPIVGHLHHLVWILRSDTVKNANRLLKQFSKDHRAKFWFGSRLYIFDCNPKDIKTLCNSQQLLEKTSEYKMFQNWLCEGIFTSSTNKWVHRRKIISPAFHYGMINQFTEVFERHAQVLLKKLEVLAENRAPFDFFQLISRFTLDAICETATGSSVGAQNGDNSAYFEAVKEIMHIINIRLLNVLYRNETLYSYSALARKERELLHTLHSFTERIIKERMAQKKADIVNSTTPKLSHDSTVKRKTQSCLDTLLESKDPDGKQLTVQDIREEIDTIIFGGFDLTGSTLKFFISRMTKHLDIQQQCREEIWQVCGRDINSPAIIGQLQQLDYLERCLKETLRLYPSGPLIARRATKNIQINDFVIPAGSNVLISPLYTGRCEEFFPDAQQFKPERWLPDAEHKIDPATFLPFMTGVRSCLGKRYAMVMMKLVMAHCLRRFQFERVDNKSAQGKLKYIVTLHTSKPFYCIAKAL